MRVRTRLQILRGSTHHVKSSVERNLLHASGIVKSLRRRRKREQAGSSLAGGLGQASPEMAARGTIVLAGGGTCLCWP